MVRTLALLAITSSVFACAAGAPDEIDTDRYVSVVAAVTTTQCCCSGTSGSVNTVECPQSGTWEVDEGDAQTAQDKCAQYACASGVAAPETTRAADARAR